MKNQKAQTISADFDRIALLPTENWDHNLHYHEWIRQQLPSDCKSILEIGCGTGTLCRNLAAPIRKIEGIDLSRNMIIRARQLSRDYPNIDYQIGDFLEQDYPANSFHCIVAVATAHHMSMQAFLQKTRTLLRPGGRLILVDLYRSAQPTDYLYQMTALPVSLVLRLSRNGRLRQNQAHRKAWQAHAGGDQYLSIKEIRELCEQYLPGASVRRRFFFRYSLLWDKPAV
ncbi:MAG: methyltransferase domain-containing protein [Bacteroidota bacterium]